MKNKAAKKNGKKGKHYGLVSMNFRYVDKINGGAGGSAQKKAE